MMVDDDVFDKDGALTATFLLSRGFCCANGCRNCPYLPRHGGIESRAPEDAPTDRAQPTSPTDIST